MNLIKWFRKNNRKIMAIVAAIMLIGFIGGSALTRILESFGTRTKTTLGYFGQNRKIKNNDLNIASEDLQILKTIRSDDLLKSMAMRTPNILPYLLSQLLFFQQETALTDAETIIQMCRQQVFPISEKQIYDIYKRTWPDDIYWLLLKNEAHQAGIRVTKEEAKTILTRLYPGDLYKQVIGQLVTPPPGSQRLGIQEDRIFEAFANLLSVYQYALTACSSENLTEQQLKLDISLTRETMDIEYVRFDSDTFAKSAPEPNAEQISEQFEKFKNFFPGQVSEQNPYGFGYKLYDSVQLQYIAVKIDNIKKIASKATQEEMENYYRQHQQLFTIQEPIDPNDSNSPKVARTRSYPEVAEFIKQFLTNQKVDSLTNDILQQAKLTTDSEIETLSESGKITPQEFAKISGNYKKLADQLGTKYKIPIYTGQTGLLNATDIQRDPNIGGLYLDIGSTRAPVVEWLHKLVFAVADINSATLNPFETQRPKIYENIGPLKDINGKISAIVRITRAVKAGPPESINMVFSKDTFKIEPNDFSSNISVVKSSVAYDLKKLASMEETKNKALEFTKLADQNDWDGAVNRFNELYGKQKSEKVSEPNTFKITKSNALPRIDKYTIKTFEIQASGEPATQTLEIGLQKELLVRDRFYSLIPGDSNSLAQVPYIMEFKPNLSYYCIKKLSVNRINQLEFAFLKANQAYQQENTIMQAAAPIFLNPDNILKRMNFKWIHKVQNKKEPADADRQPNSGENL